MKLRTFKASDVEYELWRGLAVQAGMSLGAWLRRAANERAALEIALEKESHAGQES